MMEMEFLKILGITTVLFTGAIYKVSFRKTDLLELISKNLSA